MYMQLFNQTEIAGEPFTTLRMRPLKTARADAGLADGGEMYLGLMSAGDRVPYCAHVRMRSVPYTE